MAKSAAGAGNIRKKVIERNGKKYVYWEARYSCGFDPGTGKQIQKSVSGKTQAEVRKKLLAVNASLADGTYIEPCRMTLGQWLDIWLADFCGDKKYLTLKTYRAQVNTHIKPALGALKISELTPKEIQHFYNQLQKSGRTVIHKDEKGKPVTEHLPLAAKTIRNVHGVLTKALSVAVELGYLKLNPCDRVTLPRVEKKEIVPLTDEQVRALLTEAERDEYGDIFKVIVFTGLREAEATGLTWDCIDFKTGRITVCKQLQKRPEADGGFQFAPLKNDKVRVIAPAPYVMEVLKSRKVKQMKDRLRAGDLWAAWSTPAEQNKALVFTNPLGQHLHPQTVYNHLKKLAAKIGAPDACVHDLRHPYVKHTTKIFSLRLMDFQAQAYPDARRKTRGACQLLRVGQSQSPVRPLCNRKQLSCLLPQSKMSWILYAISMRLSGYTSTRSISSSASSVVSASASKIALDASFRLSCRACSSCFCFACANTAA